MKKILFTLLLLLCGISSMAAAEYEYVPLVRENVEWGYTYSAKNYMEPDIENEYYKVRFFGDIVVDGKNYKKVYKYDTETFNESTATLVAYMREDDKKVYMIPVEYGDYTSVTVDEYVIGNEYQTYDFSLNIGDTTPGVLPFHNGSKISKIEDLEISNIVRKEFITERNDTIIEGMGVIGESAYGDLIFPVVDLFAATNVRVFLNYERDLTTGEIVYITESADYDDPAISGVKDIISENTEDIIVTRDGDIVNISLSSSESKSIRIFNVNGGLVQSVTCKQATNHATISVDALPSAIYIIMVETNNGITTKKILL